MPKRRPPRGRTQAEKTLEAAFQALCDAESKKPCSHVLATVTLGGHAICCLCGRAIPISDTPTDD